MHSNTISPLLEFIKERITDFSDTPNSVSIGNIGILKDEVFNSSTYSKIFISVINLEEERLARNPNLYSRTDPSTDYSKLNNAHKFFSLKLLFSAVSSNERYSEAIQRLERVIECFQDQHIYEIPLSGQTIDHRVVFELQNQDLNQQNQLWSIIGGVYFPSAVYKVRMLPIQSSEEDGFGAIERIRIDTMNDGEDNGLIIETTNDITKN